METKGNEGLKHYLAKQVVAYVLHKNEWDIELEKEVGEYTVDVYAEHNQPARRTGEPSEYVHPPNEVKLIEVSQNTVRKDKKKLRDLVNRIPQASDHLIKVNELSNNIKEIKEEIKKELLIQ